MEISKKFRKIMQNKGVSVEEMGRRLKVTKQAVSWVLNNRKDENWKEYEIEYWCKVLKVDRERI